MQAIQTLNKYTLSVKIDNNIVVYDENTTTKTIVLIKFPIFEENISRIYSSGVIIKNSPKATYYV